MDHSVPTAARRPTHLFSLWLAVGLGLCALFLYGCLMPSPPSEPGLPYFDKFEHGFAFLVMGSWFAAVFRGRAGAVFVGLTLFAACTEILQWASGYRDGDPLDWCADTVGLLLGLGVVRLGLMNWLVGLDRRVAAARN